MCDLVGKSLIVVGWWGVAGGSRWMDLVAGVGRGGDDDRVLVGGVCDHFYYYYLFNISLRGKLLKIYNFIVT